MLVRFYSSCIHIMQIICFELIFVGYLEGSITFKIIIVDSMAYFSKYSAESTIKIRSIKI